MATAIEPTAALPGPDPEPDRAVATTALPDPAGASEGSALRRDPIRSAASSWAASALVSFLEAQVNEAEDLGIKAEGLPVRYRELCVYGQGTGEVLVTSLPIALALGLSAPVRVLWSLGKTLLVRTGHVARPQADPEQTERRILSSMSGAVDQGRAMLVLGRPGSGVTTLLRVLANDREGFSRVGGHVDYGTLGSKMVQKHLRGEVVLVGETDSHFATITLDQTLDLAASCKAPARRPPDVSRTEWVGAQISTWTTALGLTNARETPVGSDIVRGLSGGERKRASVLEALLTRASVLCLDNSTAGLDSTTAVRLVRALKQWASIGRRSVVAGLRQVGEAVYDTFDTVCVLYEGHQVYFGPADQAKAYFEELGFAPVPGQTTADFICSATDPQTRHVTSSDAPTTPAEFVDRFRRSRAGSTLRKQLASYETHYPPSGPATHVTLATSAEKDWLTPASSGWTVNYFRQIYHLTVRQYAIVRADLRPYATKTVVNVALSLIVGTLFLSLPETTDAAYTRGSVLLLALLFNGYLQLAELGNALAGRPVVKRHGQYGFYGPGCLALARTLGDLPLIAVQVALFATITYVLAGLQRSWEHFFVYLVLLYATALNLTTVFRMFAALSPSFDEAMRYCGLALNVFVVYAGYFIQTPSMKPALRWIRYVVDPISYAYEAVLANEFRGLRLECSPGQLVPRGPGYDDPAHQTCALSGSKVGSTVVKGEDFLAASYAFSPDNIARNLVYIIFLAVAFLAIGVAATQVFTFAPAGAVRVFSRTRQAIRRVRGQGARSAAEEGRTNGHVDNKPRSRRTTLTQPTDPSVLTWKDVALWVNTPATTVQLLDRVSGYVKPGECTALMGASGAGKTTLLNALAGRCGKAVVKGEVLIAGRPPDDTFYRSVGYVEQLDLHDEQSTVREALMFSALLRQPASTPYEERIDTVERVLHLLDLVDLEDAIIGKPNAGLGLEDRKRLTIAVELCARPSILFLDEPTSGMDSQSAVHIVQLLRRLAQTGLAIIATIHQPSAEIFERFDNLLLLERGGHQVYFGPRDRAVPYFEARCSVLCGHDDNPAEFLIDAATTASIVDDPPRPSSTGNHDASGLRGLALKWRQSREHLNASKELDSILKTCRSADTRSETRAATVSQECVQLTVRLSRHFWRDASFSYTKIITAFLVSLILGVSFWQADPSVAGMRNRMFSVFLILFIPPVFMNQLIVKWFTVRALWEGREKPAKMYGDFALATSFLLSEAPYCVAGGLIYWLIWYLFVGFPFEVEKMLFSLVMVELFFFFQSFLAIAVAALAPDIGVVANILPFFLVSMEAFNGSLIPYRLMPSYWHWMYWGESLSRPPGGRSLTIAAVSPFQWYIKAQLSELLHGLEIVCRPSETAHFTKPQGQSCAVASSSERRLTRSRCQSYAGPFLRENFGHLVPSASAECAYCPFSTGDQFLASIDMSHDQRWLAMAVFSLYVVFNVGLVYFLVCGGRQATARTIRGLYRRATGRGAIAL